MSARDLSRFPGCGRGVAAFAMTLVTAAAGWVLVAPASAAGSRAPARSQSLVTLLHDHVARSSPDAHAHSIESVGAARPLTRVPTVLPVIGKATRHGASWLHVRLPGRPTGHKGWIRADHTKRISTPWHISIKLSTRRVTVYYDGRSARRFPVVVGAPSTPTPQGEFFVEEALALSPLEAGGPFALATSARSAVLQEFEGGPGQIALHGTDNLSGALGTAASHGCIRMSTADITWLSERIGAGVPLTVTG
jgi:hypothetical protein